MAKEWKFCIATEEVTRERYEGESFRKHFKEIGPNHELLMLDALTSYFSKNDLICFLGENLYKYLDKEPEFFVSRRITDANGKGVVEVLPTYFNIKEFRDIAEAHLQGNTPSELDEKAALATMYAGYYSYRVLPLNCGVTAVSDIINKSASRLNVEAKDYLTVRRSYAALKKQGYMKTNKVVPKFDSSYTTYADLCGYVMSSLKVTPLELFCEKNYIYGSQKDDIFELFSSETRDEYEELRDILLDGYPDYLSSELKILLDQAAAKRYGNAIKLSSSISSDN